MLWLSLLTLLQLWLTNRLSVVMTEIYDFLRRWSSVLHVVVHELWLLLEKIRCSRLRRFWRFDPRLFLCLAATVIVICSCLRIVGVLEVVGFESNVMWCLVVHIDYLFLLKVGSLWNHLLVHVILYMVVITVCTVQWNVILKLVVFFCYSTANLFRTVIRLCSFWPRSTIHNWIDKTAIDLLDRVISIQRDAALLLLKQHKILLI